MRTATDLFFSCPPTALWVTMSLTDWLTVIVEKNTTLELYGGDLLRSVPCVTVWHQKIRFYTVSAREKSLKTYIVYVPMITKNYRGHLPGLSYLETEVVYVTQWRFLENMVVQWSITEYSMK